MPYLIVQYFNFIPPNIWYFIVVGDVVYYQIFQYFISVWNPVPNIWYVFLVGNVIHYLIFQYFTSMQKLVPDIWYSLPDFPIFHFYI